MISTFISYLAEYLLIACLLLPALGWFFTIHQQKPEWVQAIVVVIILVAGAILYVAGVELRYMALKAELDQYDRDGDGGFSDNEYTPAAQAAMSAYTSDTGRCLVPLVALPVTLIWVVFNYVGLSLLAWGYSAVRGRHWREKPGPKSG